MSNWALRRRSIKKISITGNLLSMLHVALLRTPFLIHLLIGSTLPANQLRISDDLLFIACAIPILRSICSAWNQVPGVIAR